MSRSNIDNEAIAELKAMNPSFEHMVVDAQTNMGKKDIRRDLLAHTHDEEEISELIFLIKQQMAHYPPHVCFKAIAIIFLCCTWRFKERVSYILDVAEQVCYNRMKESASVRALWAYLKGEWIDR